MHGLAEDLAERRDRMVASQIADRGVHSPGVLAAMRRVPRERFVEPGMEAFAYDDAPLPIGEHQTISQPYIVALMAEPAQRIAQEKPLHRCKPVYLFAFFILLCFLKGINT